MRPSAIAVGTFDGVHLGHRAVLGEVCRQAASNGLLPVAVTFDRHPLAVIDPSRRPLALTDIQSKSALLRQAGLTPAVVPFDNGLRNTTAAGWMHRLASEWNARILVVGYDTTFGCDGLDLSLADYAELGLREGITVVRAPQVAGISSSAIRKAVAGGNMEEAARMLGRPYSLHGHVVEGNRLGRTIGFPTANLQTLPGTAVPAHGVYVAQAHMPDGLSRRAVVNIGVRPTVGRGNLPTVEAHVPGWHGDLYGLPLRLSFLTKLRNEERFNSIDALRAQIEKDTAAALAFQPRGGESCDNTGI